MMRHFHNVHEMTEALAEEARQQGCEIEERDGRTIAIIKLNDECGARIRTEVDLSTASEQIWESLS